MSKEDRGFEWISQPHLCSLLKVHPGETDNDYT